MGGLFSSEPKTTRATTTTTSTRATSSSRPDYSSPIYDGTSRTSSGLYRTPLSSSVQRPSPLPTNPTPTRSTFTSTIPTRSTFASTTPTRNPTFTSTSIRSQTRSKPISKENGFTFTFQEMDQELREVPVLKYRSFTNPGLVQLSRDDRKYQMIKEMMLKTITDHYGNAGGSFDSYNIIKVELIRNTRVFKNYQAKGGEISSRNNKRGNKMWLFHGSPAAREIAMEGFRKEKADSSGMFGAGIYFADKSSKSNIYTFKNGCPSHYDSGCYICHRTILFCRVLLGKDKLETSANKQDGRDGFDGVRAIPTPGGLRYHEYIVYDPDQVLPCYLITYTIKKKSSRYYDSDDD